jgi:hypothetical protein
MYIISSAIRYIWPCWIGSSSAAAPAGSPTDDRGGGARSFYWSASRLVGYTIYPLDISGLRWFSQSRLHVFFVHHFGHVFQPRLKVWHCGFSPITTHHPRCEFALGPDGPGRLGGRKLYPPEQVSGGWERQRLCVGESCWNIKWETYTLW